MDSPTDYEREREERIARNKALLASLCLLKPAIAPPKDLPSPQATKKRKQHPALGNTTEYPTENGVLQRRSMRIQNAVHVSAFKLIRSIMVSMPQQTPPPGIHWKIPNSRFKSLRINENVGGRQIRALNHAFPDLIRKFLEASLVLSTDNGGLCVWRHQRLVVTRRRWQGSLEMRRKGAGPSLYPEDTKTTLMKVIVSHILGAVDETLRVQRQTPRTFGLHLNLHTNSLLA
jgi:hypothetical protein